MSSSTSLVIVGYQRDKFEKVRLNALEKKVKLLFEDSYKESVTDESKTFIVSYDRNDTEKVNAKYELIKFIRGIQRHVMQDFILMSTTD